MAGSRDTSDDADLTPLEELLEGILGRFEGDSPPPVDLSDTVEQRVKDIVELAPTKNAELKERWGFESGSEVHQYLEDKLRAFYYRGEDGLIRPTDDVERVIEDHDP